MLKAGISHDKLYVEIKPESEITPCNELCNEIIGSNWNTYDEYFNKIDKLKQKLKSKCFNSRFSTETQRLPLPITFITMIG